MPSWVGYAKAFSERNCVYLRLGVMWGMGSAASEHCFFPSSQIRYREATVPKSGEPITLPEIAHSKLHLLQLFPQSASPLSD